MITRRDLMVACFAICCTLGVIALAAEIFACDDQRHLRLEFDFG